MGARVIEQPTGYDYGRDFMKLPRAVFRALQRDGASLQVYLACLDRARYTARTELIGARGLIALEAGEAVFGRVELAGLLGLTEAKVRTAIDRLVTLDIIAIRSTSRGTVVRVLGYGEIDEQTADESPAGQPTENQQNTSKSPADDQQTASGPPADHQPITTNKTYTGDGRRETGDVDGRRTEPADSPGLAALKSKVDRATRERPRGQRRAPADWEPRPQDRLLESPRFELQLAKFRDHEFAKAKSDWNATWRNWQRTVLDSEPRRNHSANGDGLAYALRVANGEA